MAISFKNFNEGCTDFEYIGLVNKSAVVKCRSVTANLINGGIAVR